LINKPVITRAPNNQILPCFKAYSSFKPASQCLTALAPDHLSLAMSQVSWI